MTLLRLFFAYASDVTPSLPLGQDSHTHKEQSEREHLLYAYRSLANSADAFSQEHCILSNLHPHPSLLSPISLFEQFIDHSPSPPPSLQAHPFSTLLCNVIGG